MPKEINITIENRLITGKRDMNVYHHSSKSAHMIGHNSSVTLPLRPAIEEDYLYISIVGGPGSLEKKSVINLPACVDFEFLSEGKLAVTHSKERMLLKIPPGLPGWQLKLTRSSPGIKKEPHRVIISEELQGISNIEG
jgi:hypothetical protein